MSEDNTREVKTEDSETQVINADDIDGGGDDDLDENIIDPVEDDAEVTEESPEGESEEAEEADDKGDGSNEEQDGDGSESEEAPESSSGGEGDESSQLKPVEGETPKEKALRLEINRLRTVIRGKRNAGILEADESQQTTATSERIEKLREKYTPEEIAAAEELVDAVAESKGYVKKSQTAQQQANETLDAFIEEHDEYAPGNDAEDIRWGTFQRILKSDYNLRGKTPKQIRSIFDRVHRDVEEELGPVKKTAPKTKTTTAQVTAKNQKIRSVSHSGGTRSSTAKPQQGKVDPSNVGGVKFVGFDDDDLG